MKRITSLNMASPQVNSNINTGEDVSINDITANDGGGGTGNIT